MANICLACGGINRSAGSRHPRCRAPRGMAYRDPEYRRVRKIMIEEHVALHGYTCPGLGTTRHPAHPAHPVTNPLTIDHIQPVAEQKGSGPLRVLCRNCNSYLGGVLGASRQHGRKSPKNF